MTVELIEVSVPGCVDCTRFKKYWEETRSQFPGVAFREVDALTPEGQNLLLEHQILASPGILVNGSLFSTGPVPKDALAAKLRELGGDKP
ncbi:MAG: thioredoxin family protein [Candidatus Terrybacteria bacterium]|nr:thioredoxin family protein [Candidatus Terrybacteria bacterium]